MQADTTMRENGEMTELKTLTDKRDAALASYRKAKDTLDRAEFKDHVITTDMIKAVNSALSEYEWWKTRVMREQARLAYVSKGDPR